MRASQILLVPALIAPISVAQAAKRPETTHQAKKGPSAVKPHRTSSARKAVNRTKAKTAKACKASRRTRVIPEVARAVEPQALQPEVLGVAKESLAPVPALPSIPVAAPSTLLHLERVLPNQLGKTLSQVLPESSATTLPLQASAQALPLPQSVFLPSSGLEYESTVAANLGFEPADPNNLDLLWPVETRTVSSAWGPRIRTRTVRVVKANVKKRVRMRYNSSHKGVDLTAPTGTDVYAAMDGRVVLAGKHRQYGNFVLIDHGNGLQTMYAHHKVNYSRTGDLVRRGQKIAEVGRTGNATGPHLHFELRLQGQPHNPLPYLNDVEEIPSDLVALNNASTPSTPNR